MTDPSFTWGILSLAGSHSSLVEKIDNVLQLLEQFQVVLIELHSRLEQQLLSIAQRYTYTWAPAPAPPEYVYFDRRLLRRQKKERRAKWPRQKQKGQEDRRKNPVRRCVSKLSWQYNY